ncbi:hypothetical protein EDB85DRAFT_1960899, partial [Lactarius pseudohatsudake]
TAVSQSVGAAWGGFRSLVVGKYAVSKAALYLWSLPSALADIMIAVAMIRWYGMSQLVFFYVDGVLFLQLRRTVKETNTLTAVAIASFVLFVAFPDDIYYTFTSFLLFRRYASPWLIARFTVSGRVRATPFASLSFAAADPQSTDDSIKLDTISQSVDLENRQTMPRSPVQHF